MNYSLKKVSYFIVLFSVLSCKSIEISEVKKQLVLPGYVKEKAKIKYSTTIKSTKDFKITSIKIDNISKEFNEFSIIALPSGTLKNTNSPLKPGNYFISLSIPENLINKDTKDIFTIFMIIDNKKIKIKNSTVLENNLLTK